jgi:hypothetical protein
MYTKRTSGILSSVGLIFLSNPQVLCCYYNILKTV